MNPAPSRIAVQDANVLIDMELADLFDLWFQVGIETHTTDFIRAELEDGGHHKALAYFESGHVVGHGLTAGEIMQIAELEREVGSKAGFNDCSVLFLALKLDAMLISGDKPLRKAGKERQVEVHGTLWIFDQLVERGILSGKIAAGKLTLLRGLDRFFPDAECQVRMKKWRGR